MKEADLLKTAHVKVVIRLLKAFGETLHVRILFYNVSSDPLSDLAFLVAVPKVVQLISFIVDLFPIQALILYPPRVCA